MIILSTVVNVILSVNSEWQRITKKRFRQSLYPLLYISNLNC
nr:MAG TPA: hypothetical protein [Caudoviricetes sp.]